MVPAVVPCQPDAEGQECSLSHPCLGEAFQAVVAAMRRLGNQNLVAAELGIPQAVVSKSLQLQSLMDDRGVTDAYSLLTAPPADYG